MILQNDDDIVILLCAFRYALRQRTYVVDYVTSCLQKHWHELSKSDKSMIIREIGAATDRDCAMQQWKCLMEFALEETK